MSNNLAETTRDMVLAVARQVSRGEVNEHLDPISAGFDSIATMELAARLEEELSVPCTIEDIFETQSLAELARTLTQRIDEANSR